MKRQRTALGLVLWILFPVSPVFSDAAPLTNENIVRLSKAGLGAEVIISKIKASATEFDTSVEQSLALKEADVEDSVIADMIDKGGATAETAPASPATPAPGTSFRDMLSAGGEGPEMVVIPAGRFMMGSVSVDRNDNEQPVHEVVIARPFTLSKYEITFEDYDRFTYPNKVNDEGWGRGRRPVINVSWDDATEYAAWLSEQTGKRYRLPTEAEWEYAARAGSTTKYHFGNSESKLCRYGNHADKSLGLSQSNIPSFWNNMSCSDSVGVGTAAVGSYQPNVFGLYDMHGNVYEWVQDCRNDSYAGAPGDGSAWTSGICRERVIRSGSWSNLPVHLLSASRHTYVHSIRNKFIGLRLAQDL